MRSLLSQFTSGLGAYLSIRDLFISSEEGDITKEIRYFYQSNGKHFLRYAMHCSELYVFRAMASHLKKHQECSHAWNAIYFLLFIHSYTLFYFTFECITFRLSK